MYVLLGLFAEVSTMQEAVRPPTMFCGQMGFVSSDCGWFVEGIIRMLSLKEEELQLIQPFKPHQKPVSCISFSSNKRCMATANHDQTIFLFSFQPACHPLGFFKTYRFLDSLGACKSNFLHTQVPSPIT